MTALARSCISGSMNIKRAGNYGPKILYCGENTYLISFKIVELKVNIINLMYTKSQDKRVKTLSYFFQRKPGL